MLMKKTIGYVCLTNPFTDRKEWSGTVYKLREAIELAGFRVIWIPYRIDTFSVLFARLRRKMEEWLSNGKVMGGLMYGSIAKACAQSIDMTLVDRCDFLFFPGGAQIALFLKTDKPFICFGDSTFELMIDYYWHGLSQRCKSRGRTLDMEACQKAMLNIRSSHWAIDSLIYDYHCPPQRCHVIEFGPNIDTKDIVPIVPYREGKLNVLFSGVSWDRKGGDIAVETVRHLRELGIDVHLYVAGPKDCPASIIGCDFATFFGFLDKNNPEDYKAYINLYRKCHIFLMPTRAECSGIVFCEASAFGLPCYTYDTGGTSNYIVDEYNGRTLPLSAGAIDFANAIFADINSNRLPLYSAKALVQNREKLSWEAWASRFSEIMSL